MEDYSLELLMFQSTHPRRVRLAEKAEIEQEIKFQSTHPRRVRPDHKDKEVQDMEFQSTHPRRVRRNTTTLLRLGNVSIHAPT